MPQTQSAEKRKWLISSSLLNDRVLPLLKEVLALEVILINQQAGAKADGA